MVPITLSVAVSMTETLSDTPLATYSLTGLGFEDGDRALVAQRNVHGPAVGAHADPARTAPDRDCRNDAICRGVDDGHIVRPFVGHVRERRGKRGGGKDQSEGHRDARGADARHHSSSSLKM